ncbi:MAG TPA: hypothetical protein VER33_13385 [Polyangiaceae bacterium]|nr:hypothetical protein [Polyangiaceae bacterium]
MRSTEVSSCVDGARLIRSVETRLHRRVFEPARAELSLKVDFARQGSLWLAELTLSDSVGVLGRRELSTQASHCSALDDSLALVVALLVDTPPERPPEPSGAVPLEGSPPPPLAALDDARSSTALRIPKSTVAPRAPWSFSGRSAVRLGGGRLPGAALGFEAALGVQAPRGPGLRLVAELELPTEASWGAADRAARISNRALGLDVCVLEYPLANARLLLWLGQRLGTISAAGLGFERNLESTRLFYALGAGLDGALPLWTPLALTAGARAEAPITRYQFTGLMADGTEGVIFKGAAVSGAVHLGLQVQL